MGVTYDVHLKQKIQRATSTITFFGVSLVPQLRVPRHASSYRLVDKNKDTELPLLKLTIHFTLKLDARGGVASRYVNQDGLNGGNYSIPYYLANL